MSPTGAPKVHIWYTAFAVRNEPEPVLRYHSMKARLSRYLRANSGHLTKLFPKIQKSFRDVSNKTVIILLIQVRGLF